MVAATNLNNKEVAHWISIEILRVPILFPVNRSTPGTAWLPLPSP